MEEDRPDTADKLSRHGAYQASTVCGLSRETDRGRRGEMDGNMGKNNRNGKTKPGRESNREAWREREGREKQKLMLWDGSSEEKTRGTGLK